MAIVRWALLLLVAVAAVYNVTTLWGPAAASQPPARPDRYYCAMHPQIRSPDPGKCPICGMDLVPIPADRLEPAAPPDSAPPSPHAGHGAVLPPAAMAPSAAAGPSPAEAASAAPGALPPPPGLVPVTLALDRQQLIGVATTPVVQGPLASRLRVPGSVEAPQSGLAEVRVRAAGFIENVAVRETGVRVKKGQPLAWMFSPDIYRAEEELLAAQRWSSDPVAAAAGGTAPKDLAAAARRGLELLGVSRTEIDDVIRSGHASRTVAVRAPSSGVVTKFYAVLGTRAMPESPLYEIADLSRVWVVASLHERDLPYVRAGMTAEFTPHGRPNDVRTAKVALVEPDVSTATRTTRARLVLENKDYELRPGQYGEVSFALPETKSLVVPRDALVDTGTAQYVFVASGDGRFEPRSVRVGEAIDDRLQITDGLKEGENVVTRGGFLIDSESRLRASLQASPAAAAAGPSGR
jgi:Cu(I)/Ag(I) efflux system membrane fusion protein